MGGPQGRVQAPLPDLPGQHEAGGAAAGDRAGEGGPLARRQGTAEYGATHLADLTEQEFRTNYLGFKRWVGWWRLA